MPTGGAPALWLMPAESLPLFPHRMLCIHARKGRDKLLALGPAAHPYGTPSTVTSTLLGAMVLQ